MFFKYVCLACSDLLRSCLGQQFLACALNCVMRGRAHTVTSYRAPSHTQAHDCAGENGFYAYNFDSLREGAVTLFYAMVVNNWPIVYEGCYAARGVSARFFFVSWFALTVLCVLSVIIAFTVQVFRCATACRPNL